MNNGTVQDYFIFYSNNRTDLQDLTPSSISEIETITEDMLEYDCTLEPLPALTKNILFINGSYYEPGINLSFRVLAVDNGGKTSASNIVAFVPLPKVIILHYVVAI